MCVVVMCPNYGGYHRIKHFACYRDFFVPNPRIKHSPNALYPGIKHFQ